MKLENELGEIRISSDVFTTVTGSAATNCYGVKGMAVRSTTDGLVHLLKRESMSKGVKVYYNADGTVSIELHIIVENGVNLMAVCRSIMSEVRYVVSKTTGWRSPRWMSAWTPCASDYSQKGILPIWYKLLTRRSFSG